MEANLFTIFATLVNFIILLFVLKKILFGRVNKVIEERNNQAIDIIESAEHTKQEAMKAKESLEHQISDLEEQGRAIIKEAKVKADEQAKNILKEAENQAVEIRKKTELELERQKKMAINGMRQEIAELAIYATEKILEKQLDHKEQQMFIGKVIEAGTDKWQN
ncbi:MAG: F0F1 ATP synthase subunit B [Anaerovoracaceae bacterium]